MLERKYPESVILFGLSVEIAMSLKFINPVYISKIFKNFYVYPKMPKYFLADQQDLHFNEQYY